MQCPRKLYLEVHRPDLAPEAEPARRVLLEAGHETGRAARTLFPGGRLVGGGRSFSRAKEETRDLIRTSPEVPLFEGAFSFEGVAVRVDILQKTDGGFALREVKSASGMKRHFVTDCAIQSWVVRNAGLPVSSVEVMYVDNRFVYRGDGDYSGLFRRRDVTEQVAEAEKALPATVRRLKKVLAGKEPDIEPDRRCGKPYLCPFHGHCFNGDIPEHPVTDLPRAGQAAAELAASGIFEIPHIPEGFLENPRHLMVWNAVRENAPYHGEELKEYFRSLPYPRYYLDFETISFPVPRWEGTSPFRQYPFQYSCHVERPGGEVEHLEFLDVSGSPPMKALAQKLLEDLGEKGPIVVYGPFEKTVITQLGETFPPLKPGLDRLKERLADLLPVLRNSYYHPDMHGSWSIKSVLPTVAPELDYSDLEEVADGAGAQAAYLEAVSAETPPHRKEELQRRMLEYCRMDTLAMVEIARKLGE